MNLVITRNLPAVHLQTIVAIHPMRILMSENQEHLAEGMAEADVLLWFWHKDHDVSQFFRRATRLRWVHSVSAGVDQLLAGLGQTDILLTRSGNAQNTAIAEHCLAMILAFSRRLPRILANQAQRRWERMVGDEVAGRTAVVLGVGAIGRAVARRCRALGMRIIGVDLQAPNGAELDGFFPVAQVREALAEADYLILNLPLTPDTRGMIGDGAFAALKPGAYLINVSRGGIVNEAAMIRALKSGRLAGAGCDVFETEPLSPDSELYDLPNVIVSPHMAGLTPHLVDRAVELFCENLRRFLRQEPLLYPVDFTRGF